MVGYSGTPLAKKLGIKDGSIVAVRGEHIPDLPPEVCSTPGGVAPFDVLAVFVTEEATLRAEIVALGAAIRRNGGLWICWPKKSARKVVPSDITEDTVRDVALPLGLVDNKVCAIDEVWSGLRLVWRKELR